MRKCATAPLIVLNYQALDGQCQRAVFGWITIVYTLTTAAFTFLATAPSLFVLLPFFLANSVPLSFILVRPSRSLSRLLHLHACFQVNLLSLLTWPTAINLYCWVFIYQSHPRVCTLRERERERSGMVADPKLDR